MHMIEAGIDTVYTPELVLGEVDMSKTWHSLQTTVTGEILLDGSNVPRCFSEVKQCRMKPDLEGDMVLTSESSAALGEEMKNWKLIFADDRNGLSGKIIPLHVPKSGYAIHQNKHLFDCMVKSAQSVLGDNGFKVVTVGTLGGYSQFFISIAIKGQEDFAVGKLADGTKDTWKQFFNLNSSHNGLIGSNRMLSMIRVVCMNTVQASISDATESGNISAIKHSLNSLELITEKSFARDLKTWINNGKTYKSMLEAIKSEKLSVDQFKHFAAGIFTNEKSDELSTNSYNRIEDLSTLFATGRGNTGETVYDGVNAFTEYFTSGNGAGSDDVSKSKRVASANFGRANEWKVEALRVATLPKKEFASVLKRGKVLYSDKSKVMVTAN